MKPQDAPVLRVVIAGDRPVSIFRDGLRRLLETAPGLIIVGETGDGGEAATLAQERHADVLLLDFRQNTQSALETLEHLSDSRAAVRPILLIDGFENPTLARALQLGARGIVLKSASAELLFKSIQAVTSGHYWITEGPTRDVETGLQKLEEERRRHKAFGLTDRELEIVRAVVAGYTNREIARRFAVTENTVKTHLTHIFDKLGASNRIELALFAAYHRLHDETKSSTP